MYRKKLITLALFSPLWGAGGLCAPTLTVDPVLTAAVGVSQDMENSSMNDMKNKQNAIQIAQTATIAAVAEVNAIQNKIYTGLMQVNDVIKNAYQIKEAATIVSDIYEYESDMLNEAAQNPLALAFAYKSQSELVQSAITESADIAGIITKASSSMLMDAGERDILLYKILLDLNKIKALAAYSYYQVKLAVMEGILRAMNPCQGYVNLDGNIVKSILATWKH
jgi:hypothetical protein